jgi:copper chaperone CopZ
MKRMAIVFVASVVSLIGVRVAEAEQIKIEVKGMVCSFCAQGIKKTFMRKDGVEKVDVDLDKKIVTITTKQGASLRDGDVTDSIVDAGYEVIKIERTA